MFSLSGEDQHYLAGIEKLIVQWQGWRICPMICYDLCFPVWTRNRGDYDLLLFVANWPRKRQYQDFGVVKYNHQPDWIKSYYPGPGISHTSKPG